MNICLLNVKIIIQKNKTLEDEIGNHKIIWTDYHSCFATVSGETGSEKEDAGITVDATDISFTVRYCRKLKELDSTKYRVVMEENIYDILLVDHMNFRKKCIKLKCRKKRGEA